MVVVAARALCLGVILPVVVQLESVCSEEIAYDAFNLPSVPSSAGQMTKTILEDDPSVQRPYAGYVQRLLYRALQLGLRAGRVTTVLNGKVVSEADARRIVAYAQAQGYLPTDVTEDKP